MVHELNETNFDSTIKEGIVLIDFWAAWCGPCKMLSPTVESIAAEDASIKVAKVNVDDNPELSDRYQIMSIPTLMFFKNGELKDTAIGVIPKQAILEKLAKLK